MASYKKEFKKIPRFDIEERTSLRSDKSANAYLNSKQYKIKLLKKVLRKKNSGDENEW